VPLTFKQLRAALASDGWELVRQRGSHETWRNNEENRTVTIAGKDSDTIPVGTLAAIRRSTGLDHLR